MALLAALDCDVNCTAVWRSVTARMGTTIQRNRVSDRGRVSARKYEISYTGSKLGNAGAAKVRKAKKGMGRATSRKAVMRKLRRSK
jgi:hypothetical protein